MKEGFPKPSRIDSTIATWISYPHNESKTKTTKNERKGGAKTPWSDGEFLRSITNSYTHSWYSLCAAHPPIAEKCAASFQTDNTTTGTVNQTTMHLPTVNSTLQYPPIQYPPPIQQLPLPYPPTQYLFSPMQYRPTIQNSTRTIQYKNNNPPTIPYAPIQYSPTQYSEIPNKPPMHQPPTTTVNKSLLPGSFHDKQQSFFHNQHSLEPFFPHFSHPPYITVGY